VQSEKAPSSIIVTDGGSVMVESDMQPEKALLSIVITDGGIIMVEREVQLKKGYS